MVIHTRQAKQKVTEAMRRGLVVLAVGLLILCANALAADPRFPELTGRVVDEAKILDATAEAHLAARLEQHEKDTTNQIVVATLSSLRGYAIADYGYQLGRHWGIGQEDKNNGVLLIIAPTEREVRIEVGYGLEGDLTDAISKTIIEKEILPNFRQNDLPGGINAGVTAILAVLGGEYEPATKSKMPQTILIMMLLFVFIFIHELLSRLFGRKRKGSRGGIGSGSGRSGGFRGGGGSFGGGGASGGW